MSESSVPVALREFLRAYISSVGQLEVLLLLVRDPSRWWTADQVNRELLTSAHSAIKHLEDLRHLQLVEEKTSGDRMFRFQAADPTLVPVVHELRAIFRDRFGSIINIIYERRQDSIRDFADAFRLGKDKKRGKDDG